MELFYEQAKMIEVLPSGGYLHLTDRAKHMQISSSHTTHVYKIRMVSSWLHPIWKHKYPETVKIKSVSLKSKYNKWDSKGW